MKRRSNAPQFSVIVPVFNHWNLVPGLLAAIERQTIGSEGFELLLVDNGSDVVPSPDHWPDNVRQVECDKLGSYAARNHGAARARGRFLVFTDADCRPESQWLQEVKACFEAAGVPDTIVAGGVSITAEEPKTPAARYDQAMGLPQARYVERGYGVTANLAVPRSLFERVGGFEDRRYSGGDAAFCRTATRQGAELVYCGNARVLHSARTSMKELFRKVRRVKGGQLRNGPWRRRILYGIRSFLPPFRAWRRILAMKELSARERLLIAGVQARLWMVELTETVRLVMGGAPERR